MENSAYDYCSRNVDAALSSVQYQCVTLRQWVREQVYEQNNAGLARLFSLCNHAHADDSTDACVFNSGRTASKLYVGD
jgi:hypothetical protein